MDKSYEKHAEECFGLKGNRNKENLEFFKSDIQYLAQSADEVYMGSYRYKDPAYIFLKEISGDMTAIVVNATDFEYITTINPTEGELAGQITKAQPVTPDQLEKLRTLKSID